MVGNSLVGVASRRLTVFLCHDLRDKQDTINTSGQTERGIVLQLSEWLEAQNVDVWRSDKKFGGGEDWEREIYENVIPTCDLFIVCLTRNFVDKTSGQRHREVDEALQIAKTKHPDDIFIIPIRIEQVQYSKLAKRQYINYYKHLKFDILLPALEKKRSQLGNQGLIPEQAMPLRDESSLSSPRGLIEVWNVPYRRNPHFTGRDELFDKLAQQLSPNAQDNLTTTRRAALTQPQAIKGLGGIGKTQIAVEYAYRSRDLDRYTHTLWVNAANKESIFTSFVAIAQLLPAFTAKNETDQPELVEIVKRWLAQCKQHWLLIFDNADDISIIQEYLPQRGNGSILMTTRANAVGALATSIEVETMGLIEGTHLLLRQAQRFEQASDKEINVAGNIVVALDHFPLAIDQAGAYIEETQCSFVDYLQVYQNYRNVLLARRGRQVTNYPDSVAATWSLSFQKVAYANPAAAELLCLCAFLAPDKIPEKLIRDGKTHWSLPLQHAAADVFAFNQMFEELLRFSLVKRLTESQMFSIHRLVQAVLIDTMSQDTQSQWAKRVVLAMNDVFPDGNNMTLWPECQRYLSQVQVCPALIERYSLMIIEAANLLNRSGVYMLHHALYSIAEPLVLCALSIQEQQLGSLHPDIATSLNNLASLYGGQGRYAEAEPLYRRALDISEQQLGPLHPETATSLSNLAVLYQHQERYIEAEPLYKRALSIREQQLGANHPDTAMSLSNLAALYQSQKRYIEAEPLYKRALSVQEQQVEPLYSETATCLDNLASLYQSQKRYAEAEPLYKHALSIREQRLGADHLDTATSLNNLASFYRDQKRYAEAEPLYKRAISIQEQRLGTDHPNIAQSLYGLIDLYQAQDKDVEAEPLLMQAVSIRKQASGPDTALSLWSLAILYQQQQQYAQAKLLYQQALTILQRTLGPDHPSTKNLHVHYTSLLQAMECKDEAPNLDAEEISSHNDAYER